MGDWEHDVAAVSPDRPGLPRARGQPRAGRGDGLGQRVTLGAKRDALSADVRPTNDRERDRTFAAGCRPIAWFGRAGGLLRGKPTSSRPVRRTSRGCRDAGRRKSAVRRGAELVRPHHPGRPGNGSRPGHRRRARLWDDRARDRPPQRDPRSMERIHRQSGNPGGFLQPDDPADLSLHWPGVAAAGGDGKSAGAGRRGPLPDAVRREISARVGAPARQLQSNSGSACRR